MSVLRDPLLLTLLASSLAHGLAFVLTPATTAAPTAAVRAGRTAVRLRPSLPTPPSPLSKQSPAQTMPPDTVLASRNVVRSAAVSAPLDSPPRQTPAIAPPPRPTPPQLSLSSITPVHRRPLRSPLTAVVRLAAPPTAPQPRDNTTFTAVRKPNIARLRTGTTHPAPSLPRNLPTTPDNPPRVSIPRSTAPTEAAPTARRLPSPRPTERPRPADAAPPPSAAQPASHQAFGGPRTLPTALPNNPLPLYPAAAARRRRQGTVIVSLDIDANGHVSAASVHRSSGHADLDAAAVDAARRWTFRPANRAGTAVAITVLKPFRFVLERR